jgi:hypothetical protein
MRKVLIEVSEEDYLMLQANAKRARPGYPVRTTVIAERVVLWDSDAQTAADAARDRARKGE